MKPVFKKRLIIFFSIILCIFYVVANCAFAEEKRLCPIGKTVGITVMLKGLFVVSITEFETEGGKVTSPAGNAGMKADDIILSLDGKKVYSVDELEEIIDESGGMKIIFEVLREDEVVSLEVIPQKSASEGKYKIGVWIKDSSSGIGTLTYYDPDDKIFGALGHGICDENNNLTEISEGFIHDAEVNSARRGEKGLPGELIAFFEDRNNIIGEIKKNTDCGIFGICSQKNNDEIMGNPIPVASREEVCEGNASILSNIEGKDVVEYSAEIVKINDDKNNSRGMIIKITDDVLLEKTGGIIRGMSGSPILQNGRIVGAVTHVFVNDPTRGYGIFIENMLAEAEKIK